MDDGRRTMDDSDIFFLELIKKNRLDKT